MDIVTYLNTIWSVPFQLLISIALLWRLMGPSVFAGLGVLLLLVPFSMLAVGGIKKIQVSVSSNLSIYCLDLYHYCSKVNKLKTNFNKIDNFTF